MWECWRWQYGKVLRTQVCCTKAWDNGTLKETAGSLLPLQAARALILYFSHFRNMINKLLLLKIHLVHGILVRKKKLNKSVEKMDVCLHSWAPVWIRMISLVSHSLLIATRHFCQYDSGFWSTCFFFSCGWLIFIQFSLKIENSIREQKFYHCMVW